MTKILKSIFISMLFLGELAAVAIADEPAKAVSCYVEGSAMVRTNQQVEGPRVLQNGIGAGCKTTANGMQVGGFARLDMGSSSRLGTVGGTVGIGAMNTTSLYALGAYQFDAQSGVNSISINKGGVFIVGGGAEQKITDNIAAFAEVTKDLASIGAARNLQPLYQARVGVRVGF